MDDGICAGSALWSVPIRLKKFKLPITMDSHLIHGEQRDTLDENSSLFGCLL
jgi:hypothetical protein